MWVRNEHWLQTAKGKRPSIILQNGLTSEVYRALTTETAADW